MPVADVVLPDGQIISKYVTPDLSILDSVIVHHHDGGYQEPHQQQRVDWVVSKSAGASVMEVGTATGYVISRVDALHRAGLDNNIARLLLAKMRYPDIDFYYANIFNLSPFYNQGFDCVIATEIIEHVRYDLVQYALHHCLKVAPRLVVTLPCGPAVMSNEEHLWQPTKAQFLDALGKCGVRTYSPDVEYVADFMMLVINRRGTGA